MKNQLLKKFLFLGREIHIPKPNINGLHAELQASWYFLLHSLLKSAWIWKLKHKFKKWKAINTYICVKPEDGISHISSHKHGLSQVVYINKDSAVMEEDWEGAWSSKDGVFSVLCKCLRCGSFLYDSSRNVDCGWARCDGDNLRWAAKKRLEKGSEGKYAISVTFTLQLYTPLNPPIHPSI